MHGGRRAVLALATLASAFCMASTGTPAPAAAAPRNDAAPDIKAVTGSDAAPDTKGVAGADAAPDTKAVADNDVGRGTKGVPRNDAARGTTAMPGARDINGPIAGPKKDGPVPVSFVLRPVDPDYEQWVTMSWRTHRQVCHFRLKVWGNRSVDIGYPASRGYSSFSEGDTLSPGDTDTTAFRVIPHYDRPVWALLAATITYDHCGPNSPTESRSTGLLLPVRG